MECLDETGGMIEKTNMKANNWDEDQSAISTKITISWVTLRQFWMHVVIIEEWSCLCIQMVTEKVYRQLKDVLVTGDGYMIVLQNTN